MVNRRIFVVGFGLYGSIHGPTEYSVNIQVCWLVIQKARVSYVHEKPSKNVMFHYVKDVHSMAATCTWQTIKKVCWKSLKEELFWMGQIKKLWNLQNLQRYMTPTKIHKIYSYTETSPVVVTILLSCQKWGRSREITPLAIILVTLRKSHRPFAWFTFLLNAFICALTRDINVLKVTMYLIGTNVLFTPGLG